MARPAQAVRSSEPEMPQASRRWPAQRPSTIVNRQLLGILRAVDFEFSGEIFYWRGPSPFHFIAVPEGECSRIRAVSKSVTYGWGVIPVTVEIGRTRWTTSLFPKDGGYLLPVKDRVRKAEGLELGDRAAVRMSLGQPGGRIR